jgi:hypothetical protein
MKSRDSIVDCGWALIENLTASVWADIACGFRCTKCFRLIQIVLEASDKNAFSSSLNQLDSTIDAAQPRAGLQSRANPWSEEPGARLVDAGRTRHVHAIRFCTWLHVASLAPAITNHSNV